MSCTSSGRQPGGVDASLLRSVLFEAVEQAEREAAKLYALINA
ncbi:hypothetical protein Rhow_000485 [Rhodococcus wratislaviensis]|uniref:Uncharacterized protein n=1 Tax=Rhodococcus wratislaviensis TaxID=44752 RepID=A0A402CMX8_RHOWR|nr:hypothetical protein Rhow_000485 [Rhodococcus wratislaviensis]